ncbi:MAG TPA: glycosyl hydrolase [Polyangiaceae bacterium]|nr:glycosyl hydrolase [Polyangiaceae bacterium]
MRTRTLLLGGSLALATLLASRAASARECAYWSGNGPSVYNMTQGLSAAYASAIDSAGIGGFRMAFRIDTQASWSQALFDQYDALLAVAKAHNLEVLGIVLYESTPPSAGGQAQWNSGYDSSGMNAYVQAFVDTAKILMSRYGDQIKYWEIWNEPNAWTNPSYANDPTNAGGTYILPLVYAKMLAETYVQNRSILTSKGLHLVTGGLFAHDIGGSFSPATSYAQEVYSNGVWGWMQTNEGRRYPWDGFCYHLYIDQGSATSSSHILQYLDAIQQLKVQQSDSVPLWITEFGWQAPQNMSLSQQASNLDIALGAFESRGDVARTFVFKLDDYADWGIFNADWTPKPAVATYLAHDQGCTPTPAPSPDAGASDGGVVEAGSDAAADATAQGDGGSIAPPSTSGCACRQSTGRDRGGALGALATAVVLGLARRRRSRSVSSRGGRATRARASCCPSRGRRWCRPRRSRG